MSELILFVLVAWVVSALGKAVKHRAQRTDSPEGPFAAQDDGTPQRRQPIRPVDVDPPGRQTTMPIHWEGTESTPAVEPEPYMPNRPRPLAAWEEDPFSEAGQASARMDKHDAQQAARSEEGHASIIPGLDIKLDGDMLVKGVIFSEILTRKSARRLR